MGEMLMTERQPTLADNSGGAVAEAIAAGVGVYTVMLPAYNNNIAAADLLTAFTPGHRFKLLSTAWAVVEPVTTGGDGATLNAEIGTTNVTGGEIVLTSANCTPLGAIVAGAAITGGNVGSATDTISIEGSAVTAFAEGEGAVILRIQNLDTADAFASIREWMKDNAVIKS